mmetsp:Transcript_41152/g.68420  ORF Transcript_41152/g.68420 Transcript_41152/m.68420 type:complete len:301 (+) Transcript_41152:25-927(+)
MHRCLATLRSTLRSPLRLCDVSLQSTLQRALCSTRWDPHATVHGRPSEPAASAADDSPGASELLDDVGAEPIGRPLFRQRSQGFLGQAFQRTLSPPEMRMPGRHHNAERVEMLQFQQYVRRRLEELRRRMPPKMASREAAELAFLEQQVVDDQMSAHRRKLRDPLKDVPLSEITHTNLPLLCRFVSEGGAILPRKITGVSAKTQRALARAIKRAQQLALMPVTWKLPEYRHASYTDVSKPEKPPKMSGTDDDFADPPDIRYPGVWEEPRSARLDLAALPRGNDPFGSFDLPPSLPTSSGP